MNRTLYRIFWLAVYVSTLVFFASPGFAQYVRTNLVSSVKGQAAHTDTNLVPFGSPIMVPACPPFMITKASGFRLSSPYHRHQAFSVALPE